MWLRSNLGSGPALRCRVASEHLFVDAPGDGSRSQLRQPSPIGRVRPPQPRADHRTPRHHRPRVHIARAQLSVPRKITWQGQLARPIQSRGRCNRSRRHQLGRTGDGMLGGPPKCRSFSGRRPGPPRTHWLRTCQRDAVHHAQLRLRTRRRQRPNSPRQQGRARPGAPNIRLWTDRLDTRPTRLLCTPVSGGRHSARSWSAYSGKQPTQLKIRFP